MTGVDGRSVGFVLSGGGAYAAYEVGVMRALISGASPASAFTPVDPDVITGTSAGSFNAVLFASAAAEDPSSALDYVERVWRKGIAEGPEDCTGRVIRLRGNPLGFVNPACLSATPSFTTLFVEDLAYLAGEWTERSVRFVSSAGPLRQRLIEAFDLATFISAKPLRALLADAVRGDRVARTPRRIRIATTNWRTGELRVFGNDDMHGDRALEIVLASSAIPGVFASVEIDGEPYVDGGVVMNTPLQPAIEAGGSEIHVIYMDPDVRRIPLPRVRNSMNTFYRMLAISFGLTVSRDIRVAEAINRRVARRAADAQRSVVTEEPRARKYRPVTIHRYYPTDDLGGTFRWLDFEREHVSRLIERGYDDACAHDCIENRCVLPDAQRSQEYALHSRWGRDA